MDEKIVHKIINKVKDKFAKPKPTYQENYEYAFSTEELESINKQNKQKIQELKQDIFSKQKPDDKKPKTSEVLKKLTTPTTTNNKEEELTEPINNPEKPQEELVVEKTEEKEVTSKKNSFIHLSPEHQKFVMDKWNEIKLNQIDKDIMEGKDLLNHNYTITYADDAAKFIHHIRKEYEIVICYLIGFNNEKQGILDKTCFSSKIDDEWKYLSSYIKILEKIRNFKK